MQSLLPVSNLLVHVEKKDPRAHNGPPGWFGRCGAAAGVGAVAILLRVHPYPSRGERAVRGE